MACVVHWRGSLRSRVWRALGRAAMRRARQCRRPTSPAAVDPLLEVRPLGADRGVEAVAGEHEQCRPGSVNRRRSIDSMICSKSPPGALVLPGAAGEQRVAAEQRSGGPRAGTTWSPACGRGCGSCAAAGRRPRSRRRRGSRSRRPGASSASSAAIPTSIPASRIAVDRLDVVPVPVRGEHPAHAGGPAHLEQELVLVGGVDDDGLAGARAAHDEHVVLERADDRACRCGRSGVS